MTDIPDQLPPSTAHVPPPPAAPQRIADGSHIRKLRAQRPHHANAALKHNRIPGVTHTAKHGVKRGG